MVDKVKLYYIDRFMQELFSTRNAPHCRTPQRPRPQALPPGGMIGVWRWRRGRSSFAKASTFATASADKSEDESRLPLRRPRRMRSGPFDFAQDETLRLRSVRRGSVRPRCRNRGKLCSPQAPQALRQAQGKQGRRSRQECLKTCRPRMVTNERRPA
jgi:hypothetical protein